MSTNETLYKRRTHAQHVMYQKALRTFIFENPGLTSAQIREKVGDRVAGYLMDLRLKKLVRSERGPTSAMIYFVRPMSEVKIKGEEDEVYYQRVPAENE